MGWHRFFNQLAGNSTLSPWAHPLLDREEILDLSQRIMPPPSPEPGAELAHTRHGEARSRHRGRGLDYDDSRAYQPGDDLRAMDWRLSARTGELFLKVFREERRASVFILVDRRAGMRFGTRVRLKVTQAARVASLYAFSAQSRQAAVAGVMLQSSPRWIEEGVGLDAAFRFARQAAQPAPPCRGTGEPGLAETLARLSRVLVPGTEIRLISDFADLDEACRTLLWQLSREHQLTAVHLVDPAEVALPSAGRLRLVEAETDAGIRIDTGDPALVSGYRRDALAYLQQRQDFFTGLGIPYRRLSTECERIEQEIPA